MIKFTISGDQKDYDKTLRQFALDELLIKINEVSTDILFRKTDNNPAFINVTVPFVDIKKKSINKQNLLIAPWSLIDLAYNAVMVTNDYRGVKPDKETIYALCKATDAIIEKREEQYLDEISKTPLFYLFLFGFMGEQFRMQTIGVVLQNIARELYILFELSTNAQKAMFASIIVKETGVTWESLISTLFLAWFGFTKNRDLSYIKNSIIWDEEYRESDFDKVINKYTNSYSDIRNSPLKRQVFYTKPFVKTQSGEIISVNSHINLFLYEHCVLWTIRDYYKNQDSGEFLNVFGRLFELYFQQLLELYVDRDMYERIPETSKDKRADWKLELCGYHFLVEQKASFINLATKQQESDYLITEQYVKQTIIKALRQLEKTEKAFADKKYIKIILLYEDYLLPEALESVFQLSECDVNDDRNYWICSIDDMERLLFTYKHKRNICEKIIQEKIAREAEKVSDGRRLQILFSKYKIKKNIHLEQKRIKEYENAAMEYIKKRIPKQ